MNPRSYAVTRFTRRTDPTVMSKFQRVLPSTGATCSAASSAIECRFPVAHVMSGLLAALVCWAVFEPFFQEGGSRGQLSLANVFMFPAIIGAVSAALCAVNTASLRRSRQLSAAVAGCGVAFAAAFLALIPIQVVFDRFLNPVGSWTAMREGALFPIMLGRSISWGVLTATMGLGVYAGTGSPVLMTAASVGGLVGGLMAGLLFEPLYVVCGTPTGASSWLGRCIGFMTIGGMSSLCVGIADDLLTHSHLKMTP